MKLIRSTLAQGLTAAPPSSGRGELYALMAGEHAALDELLNHACESSGPIVKEAYQTFRERLLRHIRIEERILLPMAEQKRGEALPLAPRLRLDHGALAALMMLPPVKSTFRAVRAVLDAHNPLEDAENGVYEQCERLAGTELTQVMAKVQATPRVPVSPWADSPKVFEAAQRVLRRAGYDPLVLTSNEGEPT